MAKRQRAITLKRGEVYLVNFNPSVGAEIQKTRPALILQNDIANRYSPVTIVAAVSSRFHEPVYPTEVVVAPPEGGLTQRSVVLLNQVRTIDARRVVVKLGMLAPETMQRVDRALEVSLGLVEI